MRTSHCQKHSCLTSSAFVITSPTAPTDSAICIASSSSTPSSSSTATIACLSVCLVTRPKGEASDKVYCLPSWWKRSSMPQWRYKAIDICRWHIGQSERMHML
ncbi:hypothetical protein GOP47_0027241 [Adiantum capillus-veneris]|nr:hypothetical protein GOP47_0027241 [Adiantum capillus-veneris]